MATKPIWKAPTLGGFGKIGFLNPARWFGHRIDYAHLGRNGVIVLGADEFAEFEASVKAPKKPTQSVIEGAEQFRKIYSKSHQN